MTAWEFGAPSALFKPAELLVVAVMAELATSGFLFSLYGAEALLDGGDMEAGEPAAPCGDRSELGKPVRIDGVKLLFKSGD